MSTASIVRAALAMFLLIATAAAVPGSLDDPTRPYSRGRPGAVRVIPGFVVTAVLQSATRRLAIVNGVVVQAGGRVGDAKILEILPDGVRYERQGRKFTIRIAPLAAKVRVQKSPDAAAVAATVPPVIPSEVLP